MSLYEHILFGSFYFTNLDLHNRKYPNLEKFLKDQIHLSPIHADQILRKDEYEQNEENYLLRFYLCCLVIKNVRKALMFYILAQASSNEEHRRQLLNIYDILNKLEVKSSDLYQCLIKQQVKHWQIYQLLAQLMILENYIQDSIKPLHKVIEIYPQSGYALIDLAMIYSLLMQKEYANFYLKRFKNFSIDNKYFCQFQVAVLLLCEQYEKCIQRIDSCTHQCEIHPDSILNQQHAEYFFWTIQSFREIPTFRSHEYYRMIKYFLAAKSQMTIHLFLTFFHQNNSFNSNIFKAALSFQANDLNWTSKLYKDIQETINNQSQQNIIKFLLGIRTKNKLFLKEQVLYRVYSQAAIVFQRHFNLQASEKIVFYCQKALQISKKHKLSQRKKDHILYTLLAKFSQLKGNAQTALKLCQQARLQSRNFYYNDCLQILTQTYFNLKQHSKCLNLALLSIELGSISPNIQYMLGISYYNLNQKQIAVRRLRQFVDVTPNQKLLYLGLGQIYLQLNQSKNGLIYLQKALQLNQKDNDNRYFTYYGFRKVILHKIGKIYLYQKLSSKAKEYFYQAVQLNNHQSVIALGSMYHKQKKYQEQILLYKRMLPKVEKHEYNQILFQMGMTYVGLELFNQAFDCFQQQNFKQQIENVYIGKAWIYLSQKEYEKAVNFSILSLKINSFRYQCYQILANIYIKQQTEQLKSIITQFLTFLEEKYQQDIDILFNLHFFWSFGRRKTSLKYFQKYFIYLKDYYETQKCLSFQLQDWVKKRLQFREYYLYKQYPNIFIEDILLNHLLKDSRKYIQYLSNVFFNLGPVINYLLPIIFQQIQESFVEKQKVAEYFILYLLKFDHQKVINAADISIQKNILASDFCKMLINKALVQLLANIYEVSRFINSLVKSDRIQKECLNYNLQGQILQNIRSILQIYQQIKAFMEQNNHKLTKYLDQLLSINQIFLKRIERIDLSSPVFLRISYQEQQITQKIFKLKKQYRRQRNALITSAKIKYLIEQFLTDKYLKNQLIKYIYQQTHLLYQYIDQSIQNQMIQFLTQFKTNKDFTFCQITQFSLGKVFYEKSLNQSQMSLIDYFQKQRQSSIELSYQNSLISASFQTQEKEQESSVKDIITQMPKRAYKFINLKFLPEQTQKPLIYYETFLPVRQAEKKQLLIYLIFKNCFDLMFEIGNHKSKYIARYTFYNQWNQQIIRKKEFQYSMDQGEQIYNQYHQLYLEELMRDCITKSNLILNRIFINGKQCELEDIKIIDYLWRKGPLQIIKFTLCLLKGIRQLEDLNIIHLDLQPRNIIKIADIYKIMDLDNAFRYDGVQNCQSFKNLKNILSCILQYKEKSQENYLNYFISYIFRDIEDKERNKLIFMILNRKKQEALQEIIQQLKEYAKEYHLKQFKRIMSFLIVENVLGDYFKQFRFLVDRYCSGKVKFQSIVKRMQFLLIK